MRVSSLLHFWLLTLYYNKAFAIIISPCKVQNFIAQPSYGTSLKTKGLVQIVQMPPVFIQNVMIGICENHNQNVSTGKIGEFYSCQQRYSVVEVYVTETSSPTANPNQKPQPTPDNFNSVKFVRESVIIESGCDFTFNLLPLMFSAQNAENPQGSQAIPPQQKMFLRSPYHQAIPIRKQPPPPAPNSEPSIPAGTPQATPYLNPNPIPTSFPTTASHPPPPSSETYMHGRAGIDEEAPTFDSEVDKNKIENSEVEDVSK